MALSSSGPPTENIEGGLLDPIAMRYVPFHLNLWEQGLPNVRSIAALSVGHFRLA